MSWWDERIVSGVTTSNGYLRVEPLEYLNIRKTVAHVKSGESYVTITRAIGSLDSTLRSLVEDCHELYLAAEADDDRVDAVLEAIQPLEISAMPAAMSWPTRGGESASLSSFYSPMWPEWSQLATEAIIYWTDTFWPTVLASGPCRSAEQMLLFREPGGE